MPNFRLALLLLGSLTLATGARAETAAGTWDPRFVSYASPSTPGDAMEWRGNLVVTRGNYSDVILGSDVLWVWDGRTWSALEGPFEDIDDGTVELRDASFWGLARHRDDLVVSATRSNRSRTRGDAPRYFFSVGTWDGNHWTRMGGDTPGFAYDVAVIEDGFYVNAAIHVGPTESEHRVLRLNGASWESIVGEGSVLGRELYVDGDELLVAGTLNTRDGLTLTGLSAWDGSDWRLIAPSPGTIQAVARWNGDLVVGTSVSESGQPMLHRWTGQAWEPLGGGLAGTGSGGIFIWWRAVTDLRVEQDALRVTGAFELPGQSTVVRVAAWDGATWTRDDDGIDFGEIYVNGFATWRGSTLIYGAFPFASGRYVNGLALETSDGWSDLRRGDGLTGSVERIQVRNDRLWVFGSLLACGGARMSGPATWDGSTWNEVFPGNECGTPIDLVDLDGTTYAVGRFFARVGDETQFTPLARVGNDGLEPVFDVEWPAFYGVNDAVVWRGRIAIATDVYPQEGSAFGRLFLWDGATLETFDTDARGEIQTLATYDDRLIVGGTFFALAGQRLYMLGAYDGSSWSSVGGDVGGEVHALLVVDGALIVGGHFNVVGNTVPARSIARWDGTSWSALGTGFFLDNVDFYGPRVALVRDLEVHDGALVAAGTFDRAGDVTVHGLATWDGAVWRPFAQEASGAGYSIYRGQAIASYDGSLYVYGDFLFDGEGAGTRFTRWNEFSPRARARGIELDSIAPNPMNPATRIRFTLAQAGPVRVDLYDARGRQVARLLDATLDVGEHLVAWDGTDSEGRTVASGVYFVQVRSVSAEEVGKVVLVR